MGAGCSVALGAVGPWRVRLVGAGRWRKAGGGGACSVQHGEEEESWQGLVGQKVEQTSGAGWAKNTEWADWLLGRLGRKLKKIFLNKNWIFEFTKGLEICTRRFRRNFDTRIFPKFF
jgi:hypothetical protein